MAAGAFWLFLEKGGQQLSSFIVFTIIARLIGPEEYGFVALSGVFISIATNIVNGLVDSVISLRIKDDQRLSTLFWIVMICGAGISLVSYSAAASFAEIMGDTRIAPILRAFSAIPILLALAAVPTVLVSASMNFRVFTIRTLAASLISGVIGITLALKDFGAYALAIQQIALFVIINIVVWPGCGWHPKLIFNIRAMTEPLRLGANQTMSALVSSFQQQVPRLLLGYFIGPSAAGQYTFVMRIAASFQEILVQPVVMVIYPAIALVRDNTEEQAKIMQQTVLLLGTLILPAIALTVQTAPLYIPLLFGEKWNETIPLMQLVLIATAPLAIGFVMRDYLRAHKLISSYFRLQFGLVLLELLLSAALVRQGLTVFVCVGVGVAFAAFAVYSMQVYAKTGIRLWQSYRRLWVSLAASLAAASVMQLFQIYRLYSANTMIQLTESLLLGGVTYIAICGLFQRRQIASLVQMVTKSRKGEAQKVEILTQQKD